MRIGGNQMNDVSSYRLIVMLGAAGVGALVLVAVILFLFFSLGRQMTTNSINPNDLLEQSEINSS